MLQTCSPSDSPGASQAQAEAYTQAVDAGVTIVSLSSWETQLHTRSPTFRSRNIIIKGNYIRIRYTFNTNLFPLSTTNSSTIANVLCGHFNTKKNKIIWSWSLDLKASVLIEIAEVTAQSTTWRSPSGGKWSFDSEVLSVVWHSKSKYIYFGKERGGDLLNRVNSFLEQGLIDSDNGNTDEFQLRKSLKGLLSDDSNDASNTNDSALNLLSLADERGIAEKLMNQHGKHRDATQNQNMKSKN